MSKLYLILIGIICAAVYTGGIVYLGYDEGHKGEIKVQAEWDAQKTVDAAAAKEATLHSDAATTQMRNAYNALAAKYMEIVNAPAPSLAASIPASLSAGTLLLRDQTTCPTNSSGSGANTTAASRRADAAATQALASRVANSIAAVRVGDSFDTRERQLDAQIVALQDSIKAERQAMNRIGSKPDGSH